MTIRLNGEDRQIPDKSDLTIFELIQSLELGAQPVLVELDGEALYEREFTEKSVREGSIVEIIRMVAGG